MQGRTGQRNRVVAAGRLRLRHAVHAAHSSELLQFGCTRGVREKTDGPLFSSSLQIERLRCAKLVFEPAAPCL